MTRNWVSGGLGRVRNSVFVRCAAVMALTTIVVAGVITLQSARLVNDLAQSGLVSHAAKTVQAKSDALINPVRFSAQAKIDEAASETMTALAEDAVGVVVVGADGAVLTATEMPQQVSDRLVELARESLNSAARVDAAEGLFVADPVMIGDAGPALGALAIAVSNEAAMASVTAHRLKAFSTAALVFMLMMALTLYLLRRLLARPLGALSAAIGRVAEGDYDTEIVLQDRQDELGGIARDLQNLVDTLGTGREAQAARAAHAEAQARVVRYLGEGLTALADGALNRSLHDVFPEDYEALRENYNRAVTSLNKAIGAVNDSAFSIRGGAQEIARASDDLARRTESQAATLEETAAALEELLRSVKSAAEGAEDADKAVRDAREMAARNGEVMQSAVSAMSEIEKSSEKIGEIITVIDDIAFQTNLLALNAGVEAARAGSSGKGFAVVASEVRALAQRSSDAARQIKDLISGSTDQVKTGVRLVERAGGALDEVVARVGEIADLVTDIVQSAGEQARGLNEINVGVTNLDRVTQQNTAMVEEATAAAHLLDRDAETLSGLVARFELDGLRSADEASGEAKGKAA